jgi:hypothetical protein
MLTLSGPITDHTSFTPAPSAQNPSPVALKGIVIDNVSVSVPSTFVGTLPAIGTLGSVDVVATKKQGVPGQSGGFAFKLVAVKR